MKKQNVIDVCLWSVLFWAGLVAAGASVLYVFDAVLIYRSGTSFLMISGRYVSGDKLATVIVIGLASTFLSWRIAMAARSHVNKLAEHHAIATRPTQKP